MKLNKKLIGALLAVVLAISCCFIAVSAYEEVYWCCDDFRGVAERILDYQPIGEDCISTVQTYCPECGTIFDTWTGTFIPCPHDH